MNKNITQSLKIVALAFVLSVGISYVSAWTSPTATPPGGNVAAPVNISNTAQTKSGNLGASWMYAYSYRDAGDLTDTYFMKPSGDSILNNIYLRGTLNVASGAGAGKVLTSDASGNATWQTVTGTPGPAGPAGPAGATGPAGSSATVLSGTLCGISNNGMYGIGYNIPCGGFDPRGGCPSGYRRALLSEAISDGDGSVSWPQYTCAKN